MMRGTVTLAGRLVRNNLKIPIFFILSLSQPILYLVLFGQLFSRVPSLPTGGGQSYVSFLAPSMATLAAMFGSIYSGVGTLADVDRGMFDRIVTSPVSRIAIAFSYVAATSFVVILQAAVILVVSVLMGAVPPGGIVGVLGVLAVAALIGVSFGSISNALAFATGQSEVVMPLLNFLALPMMFLSTTMISSALMPNWIRVAAWFNPLSWGSSLARDVYNGAWNAHTGLFLVLLLSFCVVAVAAMLLTFRRFLGRR